MTNAEKIQILKDNIANIIKNTMQVDENYIFNFAKQQAKEMQIEITKGEIKSIVYDVLNSISFTSTNELKDFSQNQMQDLLETKEPFDFDYICDF